MHSKIDNTMRRGIFQGCPLSGLAFRSIQVPIIEHSEHMCPAVGMAVFADDATVWSSNETQPAYALEDLKIFYHPTGITLNPAKSQWWTFIGKGPTMYLQGKELKVGEKLIVLGCTYRADHTEIPIREAQKASKIKQDIAILLKLPLSKKARARVVAGVLAPRWWYCPWNYCLSHLVGRTSAAAGMPSFICSSLI